MILIHKYGRAQNSPAQIQERVHAHTLHNVRTTCYIHSITVYIGFLYCISGFIETRRDCQMSSCRFNSKTTCIDYCNCSESQRRQDTPQRPQTNKPHQTREVRLYIDDGWSMHCSFAYTVLRIFQFRGCVFTLIVCTNPLAQLVGR
jgi:hypothetical protein